MLTIKSLEAFTGTEQYYRHWTGLLYTDGVQYMAKEGGAYWLIDAIASYQKTPKILKDEALQQFQLWILKVDKATNVGILTCCRDTDDPVFSQTIPFTDFPLEEIKLYLIENVLILPSEY